MTLPASGALRFSDLQTEYGGSNPISLSEYRASYRYVKVQLVVDYNAGNFSVISQNIPGSNDMEDGLNPGQIIEVVIVNSNSEAIYLSTSTLPGATDLLTTAVTNNGASSNGSSAPRIVLDTTTYTTPNITTGDGLSYFRFYIKTATQPLTPVNLVTRPSPERVRYLGNSASLTWPTNLQGGSELSLVDSGAFLTATQATKTFLRNGQSAQFRMNTAVLDSINSTGSYLFTYFGMSLVTSPWGGYPYATFGTSAQVGWNSNNGTGSPTFIGGSGLSNTADNVASLLASTASTARGADINPIAGLTLSSTRSGTTVTWTLTNNTGNNYFVQTYQYPDGTFGPVVVWNLTPTTIRVSNESVLSSTWGDAARNRENQQYAVPLYVRITVTISAAPYNFFALMPNNVNQTDFISNVKSQTVLPSGASWADTTNGLNFETQYTLPLAVTCQYLNQSVGYGNTSPGASNIVPTITVGTVSAPNETYNGNVRIQKQNMKLSHYYNGKSV